MLMALIVGYMGCWAYGHRGALLDSNLQNDDVRQHVMPMHRYDGDGTLRDDPVTLNMLAMSTLGIRLIYMVITPFIGIYAGAKVLQALALFLISLSIVIIAMSKRGGLACAVLLCFFIFHTEEIVNSIGSGLQRSFAIPLMLFWLAGVISEIRSIRYTAILLSALTYPSVMVLELATEGILLFRNGIDIKSISFRKEVGTYLIVIVACFFVLQVDAFTKPDRGGPPTLKEAKADPAFGKHGRTKQVPFKKPEWLMVSYMTNVFGARPTDEYKHKRNWMLVNPSGDYRKMGATGPLAIIAFFMFLCFIGATPRPTLAIALFCATIFVYFLARVFAFKLYIPTRYLFYGMSTAVIALVATVIGRIGPSIKSLHKRSLIRNCAAVITIILMIVLTGDHIVKDTWIRIDRRDQGDLWTFIRSLPDTIRIAVHPKDGDGVSYWTGRAATPGHEQLICWLDGAWKENKILEEHTLNALYATDRNVVRSFCKEQGITHFLINKKRYTKSIRSRSFTFEPLSSYAAALLKGVKAEDLVFSEPPEAAIIFLHGNLILIDVEKLGREWAAGS